MVVKVKERLQHGTVNIMMFWTTVRVGGNSGPMKNEIDWDTVTAIAGCSDSEKICEHTSVTNTIRRVARFDPAIVKAAIAANNPNVIVLNHVDYLARGRVKNPVMEDDYHAVVRDIEDQTQHRIDYYGNGPKTTDVHALKSGKGW